jgi:hypothetical protein
MTCQRCQGLMVVDHFIDMEYSGGLWLRAWRCVSCGDVLDSQIRSRRLLLKAAETERAKVPEKRARLPLSA